MKAPKLLKDESATSFKRRVKAWEQRTGQKYPRSRFGKSDEERILDGAITTTSRLDQKKDYSKDYDLDQVAKEEALSPGYYREFLESKEGQEFSDSEAAIQEGIETDRRENQLLQISQEGVTLPKAAEERQKEAETTVGTQLGEAFSSDIDEEGRTRLAVFDRTVATERAKIMNANAAVKKVDAYTNHSYTTNFKEAFRNANISQVYEDTIDSAPLEKSNVFSKAEMDWGQYKKGDTLGVMGRSQRRAYDEAVAQAQLTEDEVGAMEDTGRSASETKAIHSDKGLETVIGGIDAQKSTETPIKETSNILKDKDEIKLPGS